jgi:phosphopantetheinyl transferase
MIDPLWHIGSIEQVTDAAATPLIWYLRLDGRLANEAAARANLSSRDLQDLAARPDGAMRAVRRRIAKALLARAGGIHPALVEIARLDSGALRVEAPAGWYLSLAGQWPHCLIGISRNSIGVDIEPADALPPPADAMTDRECLALANTSPPEWVAHWAAKEAHAKRLGVAAQIDPRQIDTWPDAGGIMACSSGRHSFCHIRREHDLILVAAAEV